MTVYVLDLSGKAGNVFYLMGFVSKNMRDCADPIIEDMKSGDYNNAVRIFKRTFPFVKLISQYELDIDDDLYEIEDTVYM